VVGGDGPTRQPILGSMDHLTLSYPKPRSLDDCDRQLRLIAAPNCIMVFDLIDETNHEGVDDAGDSKVARRCKRCAN